MKKQFSLLGMLLCAAGTIGAQSVTPDVIASGGDYYSGAGGSVSWTLGEPMGETYSSTNTILTQGFQQPWDFGTTVSNPYAPVNAELFPNPTTDAVTLQFSSSSDGLYVIEVCNALGQQISTSRFAATPSAHTSVSLTDFADGFYFITVRKADGTESSTFKINKTSA